MMLILLIAAAAIGVAVWLLARHSASFHERRSILAHVDADRAWSALRHLPDLLDRHGRRENGLRVEDWVLRRGDGESAGSVWRAQGSLGTGPFWADVEILQYEPLRAIAYRLVHDVNGTHRGLRDHSGFLRIEEVRVGVVKISWALRGSLRGLRLRTLRMLSRQSLRCRLLDLSLRSLKLALESAPPPEPLLSGVHIEPHTATQPALGRPPRAAPARAAGERPAKPIPQPRGPRPDAEA